LAEGSYKAFYTPKESQISLVPGPFSLSGAD